MTSLVERHAIPRAISDEAARWVAERDAGQLNEANEAELRQWLAADPLHRLAYERTNQLWSVLDGITETPGMRPHGSPPARRRWLATNTSRPARRAKRRKILAAATAACAALVVASVSLDLPMRVEADAVTGKGEQRVVTLPDGSSIRLNTRSAIAFNYSSGARRIRLLRGEAEFTVTPDPARPFTVEAAGGSARALGTRFIVREDGNAASVTVTKHRVLVSYHGQQREVGEGERLAFDTANGLGKRQDVVVADAEAWTRGRLIVVNQPLGEVATELERYYPGYIHVQPSASEVRVSGNFRTDRPLEAIEEMRTAVGVRSTRITNHMIFLYK